MPDFGRTASDYARHRVGFPPELFNRLTSMQVVQPGLRALDLGTGTGTLARGLAHRGLTVTAVDISAALLAQAVRLAKEEGVEVAFIEAPAEQTGLDDHAFELLTAGQCWHWFDRSVAIEECRRLLGPTGHLVITHLDWLPAPGNIVELTEQTIVDFGGRFSPRLQAGIHGLYPAWTQDARQAGFTAIETFSFDIDLVYPKAAWRGRVRASGPVGGTFDPATVERFDALFAKRLSAWPEPLEVPHRVWAMVAKAPRS